MAFDYKIIHSLSINSMGIKGTKWDKKIFSEFLPLFILNKLLLVKYKLIFKYQKLLNINFIIQYIKIY